MSGALDAIGLTVRVAAVATAITLPAAAALAYALSRGRFIGRGLLSTLIGLPLVLPPTAVGFLLLWLLSGDGPLGPRTLGFDLHILLTWKAAVLAASVMALPLMVRTARATFDGIDPRLEAMGRTLGLSRAQVWRRVTLPLAARGLIAAGILGFTRAVGEFGATVILAGNIPGRTQTLASGIFAAQQVGADAEAFALIAVAVAIGFVAIYAAEALSKSAP